MEPDRLANICRNTKPYSKTPTGRPKKMKGQPTDNKKNRMRGRRIGVILIERRIQKCTSSKQIFALFPRKVRQRM